MGNSLFAGETVEQRKRREARELVMSRAAVPQRVVMPEIAEEARAAREARTAQLQRIMASLSTTTTVMHGAMNKLLERGESAERIERQSDELMETSRIMHYVAAPCWRRWWLDAKVTLRVCGSQCQAWCSCFYCCCCR